MSQISFFTPVVYDRCTVLGAVDDYFYLRGRRVHVIKQEKIHDHQQPQTVKEIEDDNQNFSYCLNALKIVSYATLIIPLIMLLTKACLRWKYRFYLDTSPHLPPTAFPEKQDIEPIKLEKTVNLQPVSIETIDWTEAIAWIGANLEYLESGNYPLSIDDTLDFRKKPFNNLVFKMKKYPFVFKTPHRLKGKCKDMSVDERNQLVLKRFENMKKAKEIIKTHNLYNLIVPSATIIDVNGRSFLAEQAFQLNHVNFSNPITISQLTLFIIQTGWWDTGARNLQMYNEKFVLYDIEDFGNPKSGIETLLTQVRMYCKKDKERGDKHIEQIKRLARQYNIEVE